MTYVANARMYSVNAAANAAWKDLFAWLARASKVDLRAIDHTFPKPLSDLWSRTDLGCAFMCGYPYTLSKNPPRPVAAPVTFSSPLSDQAVYATSFVVRAHSNFRSLEDTFGGRVGYTVDDSQSGFNAPRHHLLKHYLERGSLLYRESIGPLFTPRRVIEAVLDGTIDVGPLDSYALDLMLYHEPELAKRIRIVDRTAPSPSPFLVAAPDCPDEVVSALRSALLNFSTDPETELLSDRLRLKEFAPVEVGDYDLMTKWDDEARNAGYRQLG